MKEKVRVMLDGIWCILRPSGVFVPDYSVPGTYEKVKKEVDDSYDAHYPLDEWKK